MTAPRHFRPRHTCMALVLALAAASGNAAGLDIQADASAKDVGLPIYPGAVKRAEPDSNSGAFSFGFWGDSFGFKMAVASYRTPDGVDAVASFYRDALSQYGPVLDCTNFRKDKAKEAPPRGDDGDKDKPVSCDNDGIEPGGRLYKVGVKRSHRAVQIKPGRAGAEFTLVRVHVQGTK